ncbi:adenylate/guanylate cyclase domain-containing protein [Pedobacter africanus]|uniref:Adenylate cyclase n=1 Tax=Pedobacter africanus TaxID=151894 RepID=A0A1W2DIN7_9SPHI|nr:adenylate/guanylate cyclase domain-containing protein [Pedobacter africanus]SMC96846.1 adenylate cyclase [Pedobacter africanus]
MNTRTRYKFKLLFILTLSWLFIGLLIAIYDYLVLHTHTSKGADPAYSFLFSVAVNMGSGLIGALLGGSLLIFFINVKYQDKSYGYTVITVTSFFILIILLINVILRSIGYADTARLFKSGLVWAVVVAITQLLLQINSKFGPGVFWNIVRGKYNTPREESRIFMFFDLNSSTSTAEKLGDKKYHALLKDIFTDVTNPILDNKGEIYQYVGDEVVVAWTYKDGIEDSRCIQCFFDIKNYLEERKEKYLQQYGLLPTFKAGIHCGRVVAGEVGIIKRDITYSGDVLNTTSRISGLCRQFNAEVIVSSDLASILQLGNFATQLLGAIKLRGKEKEVQLISLRLAVP